MPQVAISVGITKLYIWTSIASRAQPPTHAPNVRRSLTVRPEIQPNTPAPLTAGKPGIARSAIRLRPRATGARFRQSVRRWESPNLPNPRPPEAEYGEW